MTVRVWMKPTELGEAGYHVDFERAEDYTVKRLKDGTRYLVLLAAEDAKEIGRVEAGRWDAALILEQL